MHDQARKFTLYVRQQLPEYFEGTVRVLDVGAGDINGNNRFLFSGESEYHGNDVYAANNVTIVCKTSALPFESASFDTIISTECFEHDPEYAASFNKIVDMLKPGGLFAFTCATTGRAEHGTRRCLPNDSYGTIGGVDGWTDYYKNLTIEDVKEAVDVDAVFTSWASYVNEESRDLYFWGIKKKENEALPNVTTSYSGHRVISCGQSASGPHVRF